MANKQFFKLVNRKGNATKVIGLAFGSGFDTRKGALEPSPLNRIILDGHSVDGDKKLSFQANIPLEDLGGIIRGTDNAFDDKTIYQQQRQFKIYEGVWKPKMSTIDENGNPLNYFVEIAYNGAMSMPIQVTLRQAFGPVAKKEDGRLNTQPTAMYNAEGKPGYDQMVLYLSVDKWRNAVVHADRLYNVYLNRCASLGLFDAELGIPKSE